MSEEKSPEQTPSLRRYSKKEYSVKVVNEADEVIEKKIRLDITSQVRPVGIEPAPLPSQAEVNEALVEQAEKNEFDPLIGAVALQAMRSPTEAEPEGDIELVDAPGVPTLTPREPLTREVAMEKLVEYLGAHLKEGEVVDDEGTKTWLADNLGTLVSSLDGTEEFVAQMKAVAKHPRFYFKKGFSRARTYLRSSAMQSPPSPAGAVRRRNSTTSTKTGSSRTRAATFASARWIRTSRRIGGSCSCWRP